MLDGDASSSTHTNAAKACRRNGLEIPCGWVARRPHWHVANVAQTWAPMGSYGEQLRR